MSWTNELPYVKKRLFAYYAWPSSPQFIFRCHLSDKELYIQLNLADQQIALKQVLTTQTLMQDGHVHRAQSTFSNIPGQ